ncbi:MAG: hypothetical protein NC238_15670 [Dehalobacter sp.]|nr:hypothetical protein [Dehalobacter sp.]
MPSFDYFLQLNLARKMTKDPAAAKSMLDRASKRLEYVRPQAIDQDNAPFIFEHIYEVIRECGQCLMTADGYKPNNSHEAIIAFLSDNYKDTFGEKLLNDFNRFRILRNDSMYKGDSVSADVTRKALTIAMDFVRVTGDAMKIKYYRY